MNSDLNDAWKILAFLLTACGVAAVDFVVRRQRNRDTWKNAQIAEGLLSGSVETATKSVADAIAVHDAAWVRVDRRQPMTVRAQTRAFGGVGGAELEVVLTPISDRATKVRVRSRSLGLGDTGLGDLSRPLVEAMFDKLGVQASWISGLRSQIGEDV